LSGENSSVPVKIPVNPHRVGLEGHEDHQLRVALKISKTSVKMVKRILEDPCLIELWGLGDHQRTPALKKVKNCQNGEKDP
jgi:hypothetical protein